MATGYSILTLFCVAARSRRSFETRRFTVGLWTIAPLSERGMDDQRATEPAWILLQSTRVTTRVRPIAFANLLLL